MRSIINLDSKLGRRVMKSGGRIESGRIANMRTHLLPLDAKIHTRLLHESRTLCGRSIYNNNENAWQWIHRGEIQSGQMPSGSEGRDACSVCARNPVLKATLVIAQARRNALFAGRKEATRILNR